MKKRIICLILCLFVASLVLVSCGKKESPEAAAKWAALSAGVPELMKALQSRVDILSQATKLPASVSKEAFDGVKAGLAGAKEEWTKAEDSYKAGKVADAVSAGTAAKDKLVAGMEALGMTVPAGMKS